MFAIRTTITQARFYLNVVQFTDSFHVFFRPLSSGRSEMQMR